MRLAAARSTRWAEPPAETKRRDETARNDTGG